MGFTSWKVTYTYTSSSTAIATVTSAGVVTAVAPGSATITISAAGTGTGFSAATLTAAASVTVAERTPSLTALQVQPASVSLQIGGTQAISASVSGPRASAATISYTSGTPAVATVTSAGAITAVAPGTATIRVVATATESGAFAASTVEGLVTVTVSERTPGLTSLQVAPSTANMTVGGSLSITNTVAGPRASSATISYGSSAPSVATVDAAGKVTAVAPGTAVITVTAASAESGAFAASSITGLVNITVAERTAGLTAIQVSPTTATLNIGGTQQVTAVAQGPRASAATITYGTSAPSIATVSDAGVITAVAPGTAVITVSAASTESGAFAASSVTGLISVTVNAPPQLVINSITVPNGNAVAINNVQGQIQVNVQLQPNGQNVSAVQAWVCNDGETVAACATRSGTPASQQTYGASGALAGTVQLAINTAEFATPNWTTGEDATVSYRNGLKNLVVTAVTTGSSPSASNNLSSISFNNVDGYTMRWTLPANRANDVAGNTWYGGPGAAGTGTFTIVPVMYTPDRSINQVTLGVSCGADINDRTRPFTGTYGVQTRDTTSVAFDCTGVNASHAPGVTSSIDNNGAAGPSIALPVNGSVFNLIGVTGGLYYQSLAYRAASSFVNADYEAPVITRLRVRGGGALGVDSGWVNADYAFLNVGNVPADSTYEIGDGTGVGLFAPASRNTQFSVCNVPATIPTDAPVTCASPVATGGLTSTVRSMTPTLGESTNLTNQAYFLVASETDRLGNRATSNPFRYTIPATTTTPAVTVPATDQRVAVDGAPAFSTFGVDRTAPVLLAIPNESATPDATNPALAGVRTGIDSIFTVGTNTYTGTTADGGTSIDATNARFAVRVSDDRSGFASCTAGVSCPNTHADSARIGTFQITRRRAPAGLDASNAAVSELLIDTTTATLRTTMSGTRPTAAGWRQFSINIHGAASLRNTAGLTIGSSQAGYYTFTGTVVDRAGNTAPIPTRNALIDNTAPTVTSVQSPFSYTGGAAAALTVQATDDAEVMGAEMRVRFPLLNGAITFARVPYMVTTSRTGLFQSPFIALTSNRMAFATGLGQAFNGNVSLPIPFIQDLQIAGNAGGAVAQPGVTAANKPDRIGARVMDAKALATPTGGSPAIALPNSTSDWNDVIISTAQVSNTTYRKNWGADEQPVAGVTNPGANITNWTVYSSGNASNSTVEFRARAASSSATSAPFSTVYVIVKRQNTATTAVDGVASGAYGNYEYRGTATYAGVVDEGGARYFRYTASTGASLGALAQGNNTSYAAFSGLDSVRAIGVDANGNGLASDAAIPGTTTATRVITGISINAVHITDGAAALPASGTDPLIADFNIWRTRNNSQTQTTAIIETPLGIGADPTRIFIGRAAANATARVWLTLTQPAGATPASSSVTTLACTSNSADIVVTTPTGGWAVPVGQTTSRAYCDIRGGAAAVGSGSLTVTATQAASAPYLASAAANTTASFTFWTGDNAVGSASYGVAGAPVYTTPTGVTRLATITVSQPTFAGVFNATNVTMTYNAFYGGTNRYSGISIGTPTINALTGAGTFTVTCATTYSIQDNAGNALPGNTNIPIVIQARGVSLLGYSNPITLGTVNVACQ